MEGRYTMKVMFITGRKETLTLNDHKVVDRIFTQTGPGQKSWAPNPCPFIEYLTADGKWGTIPLKNVVKMEFGKRFSTIIKERERVQKEAAEKEANKLKTEKG